MDSYNYYHNNTYYCIVIHYILINCILIKLQAGAHQAFRSSDVGGLEPSLAGVGKPLVRPEIVGVLGCY